MTDSQALIKTLDFQLDIKSNNESLLYDATLEARSVYNQTALLKSYLFYTFPAETAVR